MDTREKILSKALELFNKEGTDNVTVRSIAKELGISHGNLCYHFSNTDALIQALYYRLVEEQNNLLSPLEGVSIDLTFVFSLSHKSFKKLYAYRFLLLDFVRIMRRVPSIKMHYRDLAKLRRLQFKFLIEKLIENKILETPILVNQYDDLIELFILFGDFWLSSAEILYEDNELGKVNYYHNLYVKIMTPYLTNKGLKDLSQLQKNISNRKI